MALTGLCWWTCTWNGCGDCSGMGGTLRTCALNVCGDHSGMSGALLVNLCSKWLWGLFWKWVEYCWWSCALNDCGVFFLNEWNIVGELVLLMTVVTILAQVGHQWCNCSLNGKLWRALWIVTFFLKIHFLKLWGNCQGKKNNQAWIKPYLTSSLYSVI